MTTATVRTQEERRAETRSRLLEATVACLAELGWSGTTTIEVAKRAGVSRGAQQHHYRTRNELVAAAVDHVLDRHRAEYERTFTELPPERRTVEVAVDLLWSMFRGPTFAALLELLTAARTDESLREITAGLSERVVDLTIDTFHRLFPGIGIGAGDTDITTVALRGILALMAGLALQNGVDGDAAGHQRAVLDLVVSLLSSVAPARNPGATARRERSR